MIDDSRRTAVASRLLRAGLLPSPITCYRPTRWRIAFYEGGQLGNEAKFPRGGRSLH
jgi:hypothetical protein